MGPAIATEPFFKHPDYSDIGIPRQHVARIAHTAQQPADSFRSAQQSEIRKIPGCKDLPIIAVPAEAMTGDREKCMEAGAWDYLSKPVDTELMVGTLRGWLAPQSSGHGELRIRLAPHTDRRGPIDD